MKEKENFPERENKEDKKTNKANEVQDQKYIDNLAIEQEDKELKERELKEIEKELEEIFAGGEKNKNYKTKEVVNNSAEENEGPSLTGRLSRGTAMIAGAGLLGILKLGWKEVTIMSKIFWGGFKGFFSELFGIEVGRKDMPSFSEIWKHFFSEKKDKEKKDKEK